MFGPIGTEFTATMGSDKLLPGDVRHLEREPEKALLVTGLDGKTTTGAQWYRFRVIDAHRGKGVK